MVTTQTLYPTNLRHWLHRGDYPSTQFFPHFKPSAWGSSSASHMLNTQFVRSRMNPHAGPQAKFVKRRKLEHVKRHESFWKTILHATVEGGRQRQGMDIPMYVRASVISLRQRQLEDGLCCILPTVYQMASQVEGLRRGDESVFSCVCFVLFVA